MAFSISGVRSLKPQEIFMFSALVVNGGNYGYNLILGRWLGPEAFSQVALMTTLLLIISFAGMTFQLSAAKFRAEWNDSHYLPLHKWMMQRALLMGGILSLAFVFFNRELLAIFHSDDGLQYILFGLGIPLYFALSVQRGNLQGGESYYKLSGSYQSEMWGRLFLTMILLLLLPPGPAVALGIVASFVLGMRLNTKTFLASVPSYRTLANIKIGWKLRLPARERNEVMRFLILTLLFECTQIVINNGDLLLATHYLEPFAAGEFASMTLIGRVVYFLTWILIMVMMPRVIAQRREGRNTSAMLLKYLLVTALFSSAICLGCYLYPQEIIKLFFGADYMGIAPYLGTYALATALFALSNLLAYYALALDWFVPLIISVLAAICFMIFLMLFTVETAEIVQLKFTCMAVLLLIQLVAYLWKTHGPKTARNL